MMGKAVISIPLVTLRPDGQGGFRPRYIPGNRHRKLGLKGEDLRHPDGAWFSLDECAKWSTARLQLIEELTAAASAPARKKLVAAAGGALTVGQLIGKWLADPRMNGEAVIQGKKERRPLKKSTVEYYTFAAKQLEELDEGKIWISPAAAITTRIIDSPPRKGAPASGGILHRIEVGHGLYAARGVRAMLSAAYAWGKHHNLVAFNPVLGIRLPTPEPRVRFGSVAEMRQLVAAADLIGLPEIGDSVMLGLWTGQRQGDRLALVDTQFSPNGIGFRQQKKHGQPLLIPEAPDLAARLAAARMRRADWRVNYSHVILNEGKRAPFTGRFDYGDKFRQVRDAAVAGIPGKLAPMPSLADFHDQDLRDTAVTWLALSGCDKILIASITGHSLQSIDGILKHYLGMHPDLARTAIGKLVAWHEQQGDAK